MSRCYEDVSTLWENFSRGVNLFPNNRCLGTRFPIEQAQPAKDVMARQKEKEKAIADDRPQPIGVSKAVEFGPYEWTTYKTTAELVRAAAAGLRSLGVARQEHVGIWSKNCLEWAVADLAIQSLSLVSCAIYETFGHQFVDYIIDHAEIRILFVQNVTKLRELLKRVASLTRLEHVILLQEAPRADEPSQDTVPRNLQIHHWAQLLHRGRSTPCALDPPKPEDVAVLMYTSGTTGVPKAVIQTHANIIACSAAIQAYIGLEPTDSYLSYLPLAHSLERQAMTTFLGAGAAIAFGTGSISRLVEDAGVLRPTIFLGVPRVFERILFSVKERLAQQSGLKRFMFDLAYDWKKGHTDSAFWNSLVFSKTRERLGGRVRLILSGGAPLSNHVHEFIRICFCCPVIQGYGLTETCSAGTLSNPRDVSLGQVGPPIPCVEIKLVDEPEMGYFASGPPNVSPAGSGNRVAAETRVGGEIWIRGPCVSPGYYKDPDLTAKDFSDGWFHTGDIGRWNSNGTLSVIDRKKNIFKLSIGEYVAAERVEGVLGRSPLVQYVWLHGESNQNVCVAVVVPSKNAMLHWAEEHRIAIIDSPKLGSAAMAGGGEPTPAGATTGAAAGHTEATSPASLAAPTSHKMTYEDFCLSAQAKRIVLDSLQQVGKEAHLQSFEIPQAVYVHPKNFTVEDDQLTPTMKLKRSSLLRQFRHQIDEMYAQLTGTSPNYARTRDRHVPEVQPQLPRGALFRRLSIQGAPSSAARSTAPSSGYVPSIALSQSARLPPPASLSQSARLPPPSSAGLVPPAVAAGLGTSAGAVFGQQSQGASPFDTQPAGLGPNQASAPGFMLQPQVAGASIVTQPPLYGAGFVPQPMQAGVGIPQQAIGDMPPLGIPGSASAERVAPGHQAKFMTSALYPPPSLLVHDVPAPVAPPASPGSYHAPAPTLEGASAMGMPYVPPRAMLPGEEDWEHWLLDAGLTPAEAVRYAHALVQQDYKVDDIPNLSPFHLTKKPFNFPPHVVRKIADAIEASRGKSTTHAAAQPMATAAGTAPGGALASQ
jgi:long-chain acyl-CoA synthetase